MITSELCKLCLRPKPLVLSHLVPAALYDYCRIGGLNPIRIANGIAMPTSRQTQDYLLCKECEDILNKGGETWLNRKLATMERSFPLYDLLTRSSPEWEEDGTTLYLAANNSDIAVPKLVHFALGVFWKASVHSWTQREVSPRIRLGPYSDILRRWLLCEGRFPHHVYLGVTVSKPARAQIVITEPFEGRRQGWSRNYFFHVPGVFFIMTIGKGVGDDIKQASICTNPYNPIFVSEELTSNVEGLFVRQFQASHKTRAFLKVREARNRQLKAKG